MRQLQRRAKGVIYEGHQGNEVLLFFVNFVFLVDH